MLFLVLFIEPTHFSLCTLSYCVLVLHSTFSKKFFLIIELALLTIKLQKYIQFVKLLLQISSSSALIIKPYVASTFIFNLFDDEYS